MCSGQCRGQCRGPTPTAPAPEPSTSTPSDSVPTSSYDISACGDIIISLPLRRMAMASFLPSRPPTGDATQNKTEEFLSYSTGFDRRLLTVDPHRQRWLVLFSLEMRRGKSRNNEYIKANSQKLSGFLCTTINRKILA